MRNLYRRKIKNRKEKKCIYKILRCCCVFRFRDKGEYKCSFIMSKSRLAPIKEKQLTVHKLELQTVVFACRMKATILEQVKLQVKGVFLWCNSKTVINYINNGKTNFGVFISRRVNEIRNSSKTEGWCYVPTNQNKADNLTRYKGFNNLTKRSRGCI